MNIKTIQKVGGTSLILGAILLIIYSVATTILIANTANFVQMVNNANWLWITVTSFISIILMIFGFVAVYSKLYSKSGLIGLLGFIFIINAYILQTCKVSWEIFLFPLFAKNSQVVFLLQDNIIKHTSSVICFKTIASLTILLGIILFCITLFRSEIFSKLSSILIFLGALIYGLSPLLTSFNAYIGIVGIFILALGCFLVSKRLISE